MRIVFFGTPELAVPSLEAVAAQHDVVAVVCQPDKPKGRKRKLEAPPVKTWAESHGIPVEQPTKLNDGAFETWLRAKAPDVCAIVAYGRILKRALLEVPPHGFINVHPSLLPKYRGPAPIQTALLDGDTETGVSIMRIDEGMDTGDVALQDTMVIEPEDTAATLSDRLASLGARMLVDVLDQIEAGTAVFTPQGDCGVTVTRTFEKTDGRIDWTQSAERIHNLVRAANPWPMAHCVLDGDVYRIHKSQVVKNSTGAPPGTVIAVEKDRLVVATGNGALAILVFQAPGKNAMPMGDFLRGRAIEAGTRFEE